MAVTEVEIRSGTYYDSVVLMQLQRTLATLPDVLDAGVVMGTAANKAILDQSDLLTPEAQAALPDDLLIVIRAGDRAAAEAAIGQVDTRVAEVKKMGFKRCLVPDGNFKRIRDIKEINVAGIKTVSEAIEMLF